MRQFFSLSYRGVGLLALLLVISGCTKRVPIPDGVFEAHQRVVLTFEDGRTLKGRIAPGNKIQYTDQEATYWGRVSSVGEDEIQIDELVLISRTGSYQETGDRLTHARKEIAGEAPAVTISRKDLKSVDLIKVDVGKSLRKTTFWTYGGALVVLLLSERS